MTSCKRASSTNSISDWIGNVFGIIRHYRPGKLANFPNGKFEVKPSFRLIVIQQSMRQKVAEFLRKTPKEKF